MYCEKLAVMAMLIPTVANHSKQIQQPLEIRLRTILVVGYWVLGDIRRYWIVIVIGGYFYRCDT